MRSFMKSMAKSATGKSSKKQSATTTDKRSEDPVVQQEQRESESVASSSAPTAPSTDCHRRDVVSDTRSAVSAAAGDSSSPVPHPPPSSSHTESIDTTTTTARHAPVTHEPPLPSSSPTTQDSAMRESAAKDPATGRTCTTGSGDSKHETPVDEGPATTAQPVLTPTSDAEAPDDRPEDHVLHETDSKSTTDDAPVTASRPLTQAEEKPAKQEENRDKEPKKDDHVDDDPEVAAYAKQLEGHGLQSVVATRLCQLLSSGKLGSRDLDDRAIDALKEYGNLDAVLTILDEFEGSNLEHVNNKSAFLCGLMKTHRQKEKALKHQIKSLESGVGPRVDQSHVTSNGFVPGVSESGVPTPGPDEAALKAILQRTGYTLDVTSGQRKYGGPPPDWTDPPPGPGCEIFVGKIPKELFEEELIPLFEEVGRIWDLRLMIDPVNGFNRGFAFITYCTKDEATSAQIRFDGFEIRKGKTLKVNVSVPNLRLFVGNIPKSKSKSEIFSEFNKLTVGLNEVIVYSSPDDRKKNRGFCFLEYDSHKSASLAKRKLSTGRTKVWGCDILVDWADPQEEPDQATMERVKVLYVRNLVADVTEDELKEVFSVYGQIDRVKKIKDYAFIHFEDREHAVKAMRHLQDSELRGVRISVSLAKPPSDRKKKEEILRNRERRVTLMMQQRSLVPGMVMPVPTVPQSLAPHHMAPMPQSLPNGGIRSQKDRSSRASSYHHLPVGAGVLPPSGVSSAYRPVPPSYHAANPWTPDWLPYAGFPAAWTNGWAYGPPDPRLAPHIAPPGPQFSRTMGLAAHHAPHPPPAMTLNANARNHRSLWTPNGPTSSSITGSTGISSDPKSGRNWRRSRNGDSNNTTGHKSGFGDPRL